MTLSTNIRALDPIDPNLAFMHVAKLIGADEGFRWKIRTPEDSRFDWDTDYSIAAEPGQGLCAWLIVRHNKGQLIDLEDEYYTTDKDDPRLLVPADIREVSYTPAGYVNVDIDTAYGYGRDYEGVDWPHEPGRELGYGNCGDLHAWIVREYTKWLDYHSVRWAWQNEFTGEWFEDLSQLHELGDPDLGGRNPDLRHVELSGS
ncbi:hypothetical protein BJD55_gp043 [Gordonia phage Yvonnetastic]|uniref:Uncharacterized protein n=1 Tax=Gordonia phage Yvonnetastic TaxID=1821566 RepID=A0A142K9E0_9CAUD|nr:hypothetical protein BJD55_gp043 [Gordonia phage Yvonnetastic]AMS02723.1 hypothetical protein SEA_YVONNETASTIC_179 [Gordonia phage Yvonnetastic]